MFNEIAKELCVVGKRIDGEKLLELAPVYLFSQNRENRGYMVDSLEELLEMLEEQKLFFAQTDGVLCLSLEYGISPRDIGEVPGLSDGLGRFNTSLEQWLSYLHTEHQIEKGIVLIQIDKIRELTSETIWWRRFFRQINKYKRNFIFIFQAEERDLDTVRKWIGRECFCRQMQIRQMEVSDYVKDFQRRLKNMELCLDEQGETILTELLTRYAEKIDGQLLGHWYQELMWRYFMSEGVEGKGGQVFPAECITEDSLKKYLENHQDLSEIGFEISKHECSGRIFDCG